MANKFNVADQAFEIHDQIDPTKRIRFECSGIPPNTTQNVPAENLGVGLGDVTLNGVQTLTNKTITATSNTCRATEIGTSGANVVISSTAPSAGQVLQASGATAAAWTTPASSVPKTEYWWVDPGSFSPVSYTVAGGAANLGTFNITYLQATGGGLTSGVAAGGEFVFSVTGTVEVEYGGVMYAAGANGRLDLRPQIDLGGGYIAVQNKGGCIQVSQSTADIQTFHRKFTLSVTAGNSIRIRVQPITQDITLIGDAVNGVAPAWIFFRQLA